MDFQAEDLIASTVAIVVFVVSQALPSFSDHLPLSDSGNMKVLSQLMEKSVKPVLIPLYGQTNVAKLTIARAQLYIALASSQPPMHMPNGFR